MRRIYKSLAIGIASLSLMGAPAYAAFDQTALTTAISTNNAADAVALLSNATGADATAIAAQIGASTNATFLIAVLNSAGLSSALASSISDAIVTGVTTNGNTNAANAAFIAQIANGLTSKSSSIALGTSVGTLAPAGLLTAIGNAGITNVSFSTSVSTARAASGSIGGGGDNSQNSSSSSNIGNAAQSGNSCPSGFTPDANGSCS